MMQAAPIGGERRGSSRSVRGGLLCAQPHNATLEIFSTCPASAAVDSAYVAAVEDVARWSEKYGCRGILVYANNALVDPWLVAQIIIQKTRGLCPLVAVQPIYAHPYAIAKLIATCGFLYGRRVYLNMIAGGYKNDLAALADPTPHDRRYDRLREYTEIIKLLLAGGAVSYRGEFYKIDNLKLTPALSAELFPGLFVSASSEAGLAAAQALGATSVHYPKPSREYVGGSPRPGTRPGIRVGIIARGKEQEAWRIARARFPQDRRGQLTHQLAMKISDSVWHEQLSRLEMETPGSPYWLVPFQNYQTFCPYLVGSYEQVAAELAHYIAAGFTTFILDVPPAEEELYHAGIALRRAWTAYASVNTTGSKRYHNGTAP
jgi:alkanesulfonate monooxygenase